MHIARLAFSAFSLSIFAVCAHAQDVNPVDIISQQLDDRTVELVAVNHGAIPATVAVDARLSNARASAKLPVRVVVGSGEKRALFRISPRKSGKWKYSLSSQTILGDALHSRHDPDEVYLLPFEAGSRHRVGQGYNGTFSHQGDKAIDFDMDEGTPVMAARSGIVMKVKEDSKRGCSQPRCKDHANYIYIYHEDGTIANYAHLQQGGVAVEVGQSVEAGQLIGYSGNTGWSSGPHLHFDVYLPGLKGSTQVETRFLTRPGKAELLVEGETYTAYKPVD